MTLPTHITVHTASVKIPLRVWVVSWLAFPNGKPVPTRGVITELCFIKTEMYDNDEDAAAHAGFLRSESCVFVSCQNADGESII